jgi:uncharacterized metal-binding protein
MAHVLAVAGGALAGLVLTPDLDIDGGCISDDIVRQSTGRPVSWLWWLFWRPYGLLIPHRSRLSHLPLMGTALRLAYISILPALLLWFAGDAIPRPDFPIWSPWAIGGLILADTLHYIMDRLF